MAQLKRHLELEDTEIMELSQSGSSEDLDNLKDEDLSAKLKAHDGQVICVNIYIQNKRRHFRLQGTTQDSAAALARDFSQKHQLPLKQQIFVKKLVQEKIENYN